MIVFFSANFHYFHQSRMKFRDDEMIFSARRNLIRKWELCARLHAHRLCVLVCDRYKIKLYRKFMAYFLNVTVLNASIYSNGYFYFILFGLVWFASFFTHSNELISMKWKCLVYSHSHSASFSK